MSYTTEDLLSLIKKRTFVPTNQETFSDTDLLDMATDEMRSIVVPAILSAREEWYVVNDLFDINTTDYSVNIPSRAIAGSLREVAFVRGSVEYNLPRLSLEDKVYRNNQGPITACYIEGSKLKMLGNESGQLRLYYHCRPGKLVRTSAAASISSFDTVAKTVTVASVPTGWATGSIVDFVNSKPHFDHRGVDYTIAGIAGTTITFSTDLPTDLTAGDWMSLEDTSPVVQVPLEWFPYVAQAVQVQILDALGDFEAMQRAEKRRDTLHENAMRLISPRIHGETKKLVAQKNRGSVISKLWSD